MADALDPMEFRRAKSVANRFILAPLTNSQNHEDGTFSEAELTFLRMRARGDFGLGKRGIQGACVEP